MRLFYAIELDEGTRRLLHEKQNQLKEKAARANFTRLENLHLTLRFMGEMDGSALPVLKQILDLVASRMEAFHLELSSPGAFERGHKSIVWWGVKKNETLYHLQKALEEEIRLSGFPAETKPYIPHITLAREYVCADGIKNVINGFRPASHPICVSSLSLMESLRVEGKLTYLCRYRAALRSD
jgi:2'-5' RNA ligase